MKIWITLSLLLVLSACGNAPETKKTPAVSAAVKYAKNFRIIQHSKYKELQILSPENGSIEKRYALVKRNEKVSFPTDMSKIEVPLKSIVILSGTNIGMMEKIHCADRITGVSGKNYIANATVLKGLNAGKVLEFQNFAMLNPERVLQTSAKIIFRTGFEGNIEVIENKLLKLGILCIPNYDWKENHPLGKAEWIRIFGALTGKEVEADTYFNQVEKEYNELKKTARGLGKNPTVFSGMVFGENWYMPAGESFGARLFADAGSDYVAKDEKGTGSAIYSFEKAFKMNQHTEFWFNVEVPTRADVLKANVKYQYFDAFKKGKMYTYAHNMNHFWENSAIEPHHVLSDMIQIMHEGKVKSSRLYFYSKLTE